MDAGRLVIFLLNMHAVMLMDCDKQLGDRSKSNVFTCRTEDRVSAELIWLHNGMPLSHETKYSFSNDRTKLTVMDIDHNDEGNYSCKYINSSNSYQIVLTGCLLVYGAASFTSEEQEIYVSDRGTVTFDLSLSFSQPGPSGLLELIDRFQIINDDSMTLVICLTNPPQCTFNSNNANQWWTLEANNRTVEERRFYVEYTLHQAQRDDLGPYTAQVEGLDPAGSGRDVIGKTLEIRGHGCDKSPPSITSEVGNVSILESTSTDIVGNQANYSCSGNCILQGSSSLRCRRVMMGVLNSDVEWVNESGNADPPSCLCPGTPISAGSTLTSSYMISSSKDITQVSMSVIKNDDSKKLNAKITGLGAGGVAGISVSVAIVAIVLLGVFVLVILWKFRHHRTAEIKGKVVSDDYKMPRDVPRQYVNVDTSRNSTFSHVSSVDDNNCDNFIETLANEKNSHSTNV